MIIKKTFYDSIFQARLFFFCSNNDEEIKSALEKWIGLKDSYHLFENCFGKFLKITENTKNGEVHSYIVFIREPNPSILVHELVHCVNNIFEDRGIKYSAENDEQYAYYIEYLFDTIMKFMVKSKAIKIKQNAKM